MVGFETFSLSLFQTFFETVSFDVMGIDAEGIDAGTISLVSEEDLPIFKMNSTVILHSFIDRMIYFHGVILHYAMYLHRFTCDRGY